MSQSTTPFKKRIALAFDFDESLAPPTSRHVFDHFGGYYDDYNERRMRPLIEVHDWEAPLACG
jgi:hypothetical protein